jgi:hypothetical protein
MVPTSVQPMRNEPSGSQAARPETLPESWTWHHHPCLGLFSSIVGTILASMLVPVDCEMPGRLMWPALLMTLGLISVPLKVLFSSPGSIFHPVPITAAAPVYWLLLDILQGSYSLDSLTQEEVRFALIAIGLFSSFVWIASLVRPPRVPRFIREAAAISWNPGTLYGVGIMAFCLAFSRFAIPAQFDLGVMLAPFGESRWAAPWSRGALGGWDAFLDHIGYFGYVLPPITAFLVRKLGILHWRTLTLLGLTLIILALFSTGGGRRIVGVMVGSGLVVWFLSSRAPNRKDLLILGGCCIGLLLFMQTMLVYRAVGISAAFSEETEIADEDKPDTLRVDDNFLRLVQVIHIFPDLHPHTGMKYVVWVAVRPIPRVIWPEKPISPGFDLPAYLGLRGVSLTMSLVGELYMAFGFLGCVGGGLLLGYLANGLAQVLRDGATPGALIIFGGSLLALFAGMRSGIELVLMSYGVLAWIALTWILRRREI